MSNNKIEIKKDLFDFLYYSYFGLTDDSDDSDKAFICARRAYLDLCRTLKFEEKKGREDFRTKTSKYICDEIEKIPSVPSDKGDLNDWYSGVCEEICNRADDSKLFKIFHFGQAQKWLNMTIKYMLIMGLYSEKFEAVKEHLHVPVDSYIIEAAKKFLKIDCDDTTWSEWKKGTYEKFQNDLREQLTDAPIDWEGRAWIEIAKEKNKKFCQNE